MSGWWSEGERSERAHDQKFCGLRKNNNWTFVEFVREKACLIGGAPHSEFKRKRNFENWFD